MLKQKVCLGGDLPVMTSSNAKIITSCEVTCAKSRVSKLLKDRSFLLGMNRRPVINDVQVEGMVFQSEIEERA